MNGATLYGLCQDLYPICRSITGPGVRETLKRLSEVITLGKHEVPSGTSIFDWTVPDEWSLDEAYLLGPSGQRVVDTSNHNLHVVSYSEPVDLELSLEALQPHLHSLPDQPDLIPYRTSYFERRWGFCLSHRQRESLEPGTYRAVVRSELAPGALSYGELFLPGTTGRELLISTHICHPSLANDNLSGLSVAIYLARHFADRAPGPFGLRFVFVPGTIGAIAWLSQNQNVVQSIDAGVVLSGIGDAGGFTYKQSRQGDGLLDRIFRRRLAGFEGATVRPFMPYGYDERQYCSPGIDIAAGCLMRTPYGEYPEYHSSGDNLDLIRAESLEQSLKLCIEVLEEAQDEARYLNLSPNCEPQLGKRGLYDNVGGQNQSQQIQLAMLWWLSCGDGTHSARDVSEKSGLPVDLLEQVAQRLVNAELLALTGPR